MERTESQAHSSSEDTLATWTTEERAELKAAFDEHGPDAGGRISRSQLNALLVDVGQEPASDAANQR